MKKLTTFILLIIFLLTVTVTFVGCGDKDFSDLEKRIGELENNYNYLNNKYNELDVRVKKLEATISLLDTVGESEQFTELKNKVIALQKDLVDNTANDTQIKTQVTQMQLTLDKIAGGGNVDDTVLLEIQNKLNTLYGEVNRVLPFENGKEYEVKLNGVVYYTVSVLIEYHDGIVKSNQDIKNCTSSGKHICGSVKLNNNMVSTIKSQNMSSMMLHKFDNAVSHSSIMYEKDGYTAPTVTQIAYGEEVRWYYYITPNSEIKSNYKIVLRIPDNNLDVLVLDNVWGGENGLKPPIVGTKN